MQNPTPINQKDIVQLCQQFHCPKVVAEVLHQRNFINKRELPFYFETGMQYLHNPFLLPDITQAVDILHKAQKEAAKVLIFGDRDVDGITSTVLLVNALKRLNFSVRWDLPEKDELYGLRMKDVEEFHAEGGGVLIMVDCGSSSLEEIRRAQSYQISTIVIDHHKLPPTVPPADALVNPHISGSVYPFPEVCACALVAKFIWALDFSFTPWYNRSFCLLQIRPGNNKTLIVEMRKQKNLLTIADQTEVIVPEVVANVERMQSFLSEDDIFVYDLHSQEKVLNRLLPSAFLSRITTLQPVLEKSMPQVKGKTILEIRDHSRSRRYLKEYSEMDVVQSMFLHYVDICHPLARQNLSESLDLVSIATVADMMPLKNENRIMVRRGLEQINTRPRQVMVDFLLAGKFSRPLSSRNLSWTIIPVLNATGRMGNPHISARAFLSDTPVSERKEAVKQSFRLNRQRRSLGETAWREIAPHAEKSFQSCDGKFIHVLDKSISRGITGIIANRLMGHYKVPSMAMAPVEHRIIGSVRSGDSLHVTDFLSKFTGIVDGYGGHPSAGGFHFSHDKLPEFYDCLNSLISKYPKPVQAMNSLNPVDVVYDQKDFTPEVEALVQFFEPYGHENPPLLMEIRGMKISEISLLGSSQDHVSMTLQTDHHKWPAVYWKQAKRVVQELQTGMQITLYCHVERNNFLSRSTLRLQIVDYHIEENT